MGKLESSSFVQRVFFSNQGRSMTFCLLSVFLFNFQKHGFRRIHAHLPGWTQMLHLHELLHRPRHHRLWAQLLPSLPVPLLGGRTSPKELPWVQGSVRETRFQNQYCTQEAGFPCQTGQSFPQQQLWGAALWDTQRSEGALLWSWQDPAVWPLLWRPRTCCSQPQSHPVGCWGTPGRWCFRGSLESGLLHQTKVDANDNAVEVSRDGGAGGCSMQSPRHQGSFSTLWPAAQIRAVAASWDMWQHQEYRPLAGGSLTIS